MAAASVPAITTGCNFVPGRCSSVMTAPVADPRCSLDLPSALDQACGAVLDELDAPVVPMDGFHLPNAILDERGLRAVKGAPRTFDARGFVDVVKALGAGDDMSVPAFDRLVDEPELMMFAVEEFLRAYSPVDSGEA